MADPARTDPPANDPLQAVTRLVPLHSLPARERTRLGVKLKRGHPVQIVPVVEPDSYNIEVSRLRAEGADHDPVVEALADEGDDTQEILWCALEQMAREAAALKFDRLESEKSGKDITALASRRVSGLAAVARLVLEGRRMGLFGLDHRAMKVTDVEQLWLSLLSDCATEVLGSGTDAFLVRMKAAMEGWRDKVESGG